MGRTLQTSTQLIREFEATWQPYLRALRKEDREVVLQLLAMIQAQSAPIAYASHDEPFQLFVLAMLGGVLKRLNTLEQKLSAHQTNIAKRLDE
ncbi:MAG: hypothetical protein HZB51_11845 [Chloroflexi bacterium]|nr:hypothetical protein [Chloroflexota bacterium]